MFNTSYFPTVSSFDNASFSPIHSTSPPCTLHLGLQDHRKGAAMWSHLNDTVTSGPNLLVISSSCRCPTLPNEWLKESQSYLDILSESLLVFSSYSWFSWPCTTFGWSWRVGGFLSSQYYLKKYNNEHTKQKTREYERKKIQSVRHPNKKPLLFEKHHLFSWESSSITSKEQELHKFQVAYPTNPTPNPPLQGTDINPTPNRVPASSIANRGIFSLCLHIQRGQGPVGDLLGQRHLESDRGGVFAMWSCAPKNGGLWSCCGSFSIWN